MSAIDVALMLPLLALDTSVNVIFGEIGTVTVSPALFNSHSNS
jgi:hypothetical protein